MYVLNKHKKMENCRRRTFAMASDLAAIALFLVFTCLQTANGQSVKVTRSAGQSDEFTFFDQAGLASCGESRLKSCKDYGATSVERPCDSTGLCSCQTCRCGSENPTFLSHIRKCAEERNITSMLRKANLTGKSFDKFLTLSSCLQRRLPCLYNDCSRFLFLAIVSDLNNEFMSKEC